MNYRRLGNTGMKISEVSLGAWTTYGGSVQDKKLITQIVEKALEHGVNFFDNADAYARGKGESYMGEVFKDIGAERRHLVLSTKVYWPFSDDDPNDRGLSRKHVLESIDGSLERMGTDYVDIYFAHRYDEETTMEEIVEVFSDVVKSGRAHYWGHVPSGARHRLPRRTPTPRRTASSHRSPSSRSIRCSTANASRSKSCP